MKAPAFWWRPAGPAATALAPLAAIYGRVSARRMARPGIRSAIPVICVGNVTVGGSGKTPVALALAGMLARMGHRPFGLTRGYGGTLAGPIRVDPAHHDSADVGDEALLLARSLPTMVARDRPAGARAAQDGGADIVLMDDGLQNPSLTKDLALAVFDGAVGLGNGRCLPAGPLRAPMEGQWPRIDAAIVIGEGIAGDRIAATAAAHAKPVFRAALVPDPAIVARFAGRRVLAFAGIGRPAKFFKTLAACGAEIVHRREFPDHHPYTAAQIGTLLDSADRDRLLPVTTEKDAVRLAGLAPGEPRIARVTTLPVRLVFDDPEALQDLVAVRLRAAFGLRR